MELKERTRVFKEKLGSVIIAGRKKPEILVIYLMCSFLLVFSAYCESEKVLKESAL